MDDDIHRLNAMIEAERTKQHEMLAAHRAEIQRIQEKLEQERHNLAERIAEQREEIRALSARIEISEARTKAAEERLQDSERWRGILAARADAAEKRLEDLLRSTSWAATAPLRFAMERVRVVKRFFRAPAGKDPAVLAHQGEPALHEAAVASYAAWSARFDTPDVEDTKRLQVSAGDVPEAFFFIGASSGTLAFLDRTLEALRMIVGLRWHAQIIFDEECDARTSEAHAHALIDDPRFLQAGDTTPADAVVLLLEAGAIPRPHGPRILVDALAADQTAMLAYSDEDRLGADGVPHTPFFKPKFARRLAEAGILLGRMTAVRPSVHGIAGLASRLRMMGGGAASLARDIALELADRKILHVPHVTFHDVALPRVPSPSTPPLPDRLPGVSIVIPTRDSWNLLQACLASLKMTDWPRHQLDVIVVDNNSTEAETLDGLAQAEAAGEIRVLRDPHPFNYARLNNAAAQLARGELLVLLNNDTEVLDPAWLKKLAAYALLPDAGAVGTKLLYGDGKVQHGGIILGVQGAAAHAHLFLGAEDPGYAGLAKLTHEISAVTGACLMVRRDRFLAVGGLREEFRVSFNDVMLCLDLLMQGLDNFYVGDPLITHHESKTRGYDDTPEKIRLARHETCLALRVYPELFRNDPFYSPNLSLEVPYKLAFAPRRRSAWKAPAAQSLKVLFLSITYARGHGVAVVIEQQVRALVKAGHQVLLAGEKSDRDFGFGEQAIFEVHDPRSAATLASDLNFDVIVAHTPPYFGVARWVGTYPPVLAYDYGEPPPELFSEAPERRNQLEIKAMELAAATRVLAISDAVANEAAFPPDGVVPLGNSHLGRWDELAARRRTTVRADRGWEDSTVILNVCRFHAGERAYKGVDTYTFMRDSLMRMNPALGSKTVFVLCGKGTADDVVAMEGCGLTVIANVDDEEMFDLYAASDFYASFSRWEGYNLGIGQALAMGLPVIASDIPAHKAFGVAVTNDPDEAARFIVNESGAPRNRVPRIWEWKEPLESFVAQVEEVARGGQARRVHQGGSQKMIPTTPG